MNEVGRWAFKRSERATKRSSTFSGVSIDLLSVSEADGLIRRRCVNVSGRIRAMDWETYRSGSLALSGVPEVAIDWPNVGHGHMICSLIKHGLGETSHRQRKKTAKR